MYRNAILPLSYVVVTAINGRYRTANLLSSLCFFLALMSNTVMAKLPEPQGEHVNDFANLIPYDYEAELREKLESVEYYSGVEIVVVTIDSYSEYIVDYPRWESFATALFNQWGIGNLPANNGVMLLISKSESRVRIELGASYPRRFDSIMKSIIDETVHPNVKAGNYTKALVEGSDRIITAVTRPVSFWQWYKWYILAGIGAFLSTLIALSIDKNKNPGLFWLLLGLVGFLVIGLWRGLDSGRASDGFGGGDSDGGGASDGGD